MNMSPQHSEELSLLWSVILETYATANLFIIEGQRLTVELFERHLFKRISQFCYETADQFVCRLRQLTASCDFAEFEDDHIRVNR